MQLQARVGRARVSFMCHVVCTAVWPWLNDDRMTLGSCRGRVTNSCDELVTVHVLAWPCMFLSVLACSCMFLTGGVHGGAECRGDRAAGGAPAARQDQRARTGGACAAWGWLALFAAHDLTHRPCTGASMFV